MLIIPAIDLQDGCVVRFIQGRRDKKIYSQDPVKTARHWARQGAGMLHVVDLDGAFSGKLKNLKIVKEIAKSIEVPVQFGGGVRQIEVLSGLLKSGVWRVVLGTKAVEDKDFLKMALKKFSDRIIVSIDSAAGAVFTKGWQKAHKLIDALAFARRLKEMGFREIIYTDISRDGTLCGPNIQEIKRLLRETALKIIASGGISSLADLRKLKALGKKGLTGVIVGKALYEGRFTLSEALKLS